MTEHFNQAAIDGIEAWLRLADEEVSGWRFLRQGLRAAAKTHALSIQAVRRANIDFKRRCMFEVVSTMISGPVFLLDAIIPYDEPSCG